MTAGRIKVDLSSAMYAAWQRGKDAGKEPTVRQVAEATGASIHTARAALRRFRAGRIPAARSASLEPDRQLGASRTLATVNDRLWMATGNNLQVGGDMASRTVRVHLDPNMPKPESRDQSRFGIPHLDQWITVPANQLTVLWHLLVLVLDWTRYGAPRATTVAMRQFTPWAQALGGFLAHHDIDGFLTNAADIREIDEDETRWRAFLTCWHDHHGYAKLTAAELRRDGEPVSFSHDVDGWDGQFITTHTGRLPNPLTLGRLLTGQIGRRRGPYVLRSQKNDRGDRNVFRVEHHDG